MAKRIYNQTALFGPLYAYLVVISPPEGVLQQLQQIKNEMSAIADIGLKNLNATPHITLVEKLTDDVDFPQTISRLLHGQKSFEITVRGIDCFEANGLSSCFLKVGQPQEISKMMARLKNRGSSALLTLLKKVPSESFALLADYRDSLAFEAKWNCEEVVVLRKKMSEKQKGFNEKFIVRLDAH